MNYVAADVVLVVHFAIAAFIVAGVVATTIGGLRRWAWVRRRGWRLAHLAAVLVVAVEALIGIVCPLTVLEDHLRGLATERSFVDRWVGALLYWDFPPIVFTTAYVLVALITVALYAAVPPGRNARAEA